MVKYYFYDSQNRGFTCDQSGETEVVTHAIFFLPVLLVSAILVGAGSQVVSTGRGLKAHLLCNQGGGPTEKWRVLEA